MRDGGEGVKEVEAESLECKRSKFIYRTIT